MIKFLSTLLLAFCFTTNFSQNLVTEKYSLSKQVKETSGLLFFNNKTITHNDSGNTTQLFELDTLDGRITRIIDISNATNTDWEDITEDDTFIYIADMGNNYSSRKDLKIYRISKEDYTKNNAVDAEIISFSYSNQESFYPNKKNDFDAEAIIIQDNQFIIFSKNRGDKQTRVYTLKNEIGEQIANYSHTYNIEGLITGATINKENNQIILCGYSDGLTPFLVVLNSYDATSFTRIDLTPMMGLANQIEGITHIKGDKYFVSREKLKKKIGGYSISVPAKLFEVDLSKIDLHQSEVSDYLKSISSVKKLKEPVSFKKVTILNDLKETMLIQMDSLENISTANFRKGNYSIQIIVNDTISVTSKLVVD
ncbi:MAG: hypothetical protein COB73_03710 [Flavobacteriaceae bacterium]|nr:MAG: hypothetical protein COB73_03710 [Flavobacteriaceae bacterium]